MASSKKASRRYPGLETEMFKGSPIEVEYKKLSPTPDQFETFVKQSYSFVESLIARSRCGLRIPLRMGQPLHYRQFSQ